MLFDRMKDKSNDKHFEIIEEKNTTYDTIKQSQRDRFFRPKESIRRVVQDMGLTVVNSANFLTVW